MNRVILIGRLTRDPDVRYTTGEEGNHLCIARYTMAVDRVKKVEGQQSADFISCVAIGRAGEFAEKYLRKGTKIAVTGRIQTGSYKNKDGQTIYTTDVNISEHEFVESKRESEADRNARDMAAVNGAGYSTDADGFMNIPEGIEELPFN